MAMATHMVTTLLLWAPAVSAFGSHASGTWVQLGDQEICASPTVDEQGVADDSFGGCASVSNASAGTSYYGEFVDGVYDGFGSWVDADGNAYVGEFADGERNGAGIQDVAPSAGIWTQIIGEYVDGT